MKYIKSDKNYLGISYPIGFLQHIELFYKFWKKYMCKRGYHLLDEVASATHHFMYCDACSMIIDINSIMELKDETD